jgi:uncharacterized protein
MSLLYDPWFYATALPAVTLYGLSKGGFSGVSLLSLPLMSLVMPPLQAAAILLPVLLVQDAVTVISFRKTWDRSTLIHIMPGAIAGIVLGWLTASIVPQGWVRLAVGVIALIFCLNAWFLAPRRARAAHGDGSPSVQDWTAASLLGTASGYTSFVVHAGSPPFLLYAVPRVRTKEVLAGTMAIAFAFINVLKVPPYLGLGQFTQTNLLAAAALMPMAVVANLGGVWLVRRISPVLFFKVITWLTFAVGLTLIVQGFRY